MRSRLSITLIFICIILSNCTRSRSSSSVEPAPKWIAHALGGYKNAAYLNCKECFETNYALGFRYFEMDFVMSSDGYMAGIHDGQEASFGLPTPFTNSQFKTSSVAGTTRVDEDSLIELLKTNSDWFLITDIKTDNSNGLKRLCEIFKKSQIDCLSRIIPQFYDPLEFRLLDEYPFKRSIFTLYRFGNNIEAVEKALKADQRIWALTVSSDWWNEEFKSLVKRQNVASFVHTINDKAKANQYLETGVSGLYTDFLFY